MDKITEIQCMVEHARVINLYSPCSFRIATLESIMKAYNGAGPDWMRLLPRQICTWLLRTIKIAVMIHDWDYQNSDGTEYSFTVANLRFWKNSVILINDKYDKWFLFPVKLYAKSKAYGAYYAVKWFGWKAWEDGYNGIVHRKIDYNRSKGGQGGEEK